MVQGVEVLAVIEIPQHGLGVLASGSAEGAVGRHGDGVQVAGVADVVGLQLAVGQVPHLDVLVPPGGDDDGVLVVGENLTQETQSWWPSSWMVYLHWARVFHSLMVLSLAAETICLLSAEKATESTSLVWSSNLRVVLPVERSH